MAKSAGAPAGGGSKPRKGAGTAGGPAENGKEEPAGKVELPGGIKERDGPAGQAGKREGGTPEGKAGKPSGKTGVHATEAKEGFTRRNRFRQNRVVCYTCGKSGHISIECPDYREKVRCYACGKHGHISYECTAAREGSKRGTGASCSERVKGRALYASKVGKWVAHNMLQGRSVLFNSRTGTCKILRGSEVVGGAHFENGQWIVGAQKEEKHKRCFCSHKGKQVREGRGLELAPGVEKLQGCTPNK